MDATAEDENENKNNVPSPSDEVARSGRSEPESDRQGAAPGMSTAARLRAEAAEALAKMAALSPREREVIDSIAQGLSIKEIARRLSVSPKSVETYRARLIEKLDAKSPTALMRIAVLVSLMDDSRDDPASEGGTPPETP